MTRQSVLIIKRDALVAKQYVFTREQFASMPKPNAVMAIQYALTAKQFALVAKQIALIVKQYALVERHRHPMPRGERNDVALRPDQLAGVAQILGVRVEALIEEPQRANRRGAPTGRARQVFETVSQMPRHQQKKIIDVVEALVAQHKSSRGQVS